jgi:tRNA(Ile2) C34 agmatinyltransferase TiaS
VNLVNLLNPRMWFSAGVTTILALVPVGLVYEPAVEVLALPIFVVLMLLMCGVPAQCPQCRRRVKIAASRCPHCGVEIAAG